MSGDVPYMGALSFTVFLQAFGRASTECMGDVRSFFMHVRWSPRLARARMSVPRHFRTPLDMNMKQNNSVVEIALAANDEYFDGLLVTACSIARFANAERQLVLTILDGGIETKKFTFLKNRVLAFHSRTTLEVIRINEADLSAFPLFHGNRMAYARLLLPHLKPKTKHVIYCDVDFLWMADISELWDLQDDSVPYQSTKDMVQSTIDFEREWFYRNSIPFNADYYFCTGLSFFNLNAFREKDLTASISDFLRKHQDVLLADQTAMNALIGKESGLLPQRWQIIPRYVPDSIYDTPIVLHYAGEPPWSISNTSKMLTDTQLLWFCFDATIRGCTTWQSLRRYYSAMQIIVSRLTFKIIMSTTITRHLFYWLLKSLGRWKFKETIPKKRFRTFMQQLTDNSYWAKGHIRD